jgi:hypothetical protein
LDKSAIVINALFVGTIRHQNTHSGSKRLCTISRPLLADTVLDTIVDCGGEGFDEHFAEDFVDMEVNIYSVWEM